MSRELCAGGALGPLLVFPGPPTGFPKFRREVRSLGLQKETELQFFRAVLLEAWYVLSAGLEGKTCVTSALAGASHANGCPMLQGCGGRVDFHAA